MLIYVLSHIQGWLVSRGYGQDYRVVNVLNTTSFFLPNGPISRPLPEDKEIPKERPIGFVVLSRKRGKGGPVCSLKTS
jgi:hypothetical protein